MSSSQPPRRRRIAGERRRAQPRPDDAPAPPAAPAQSAARSTRSSTLAPPAEPPRAAPNQDEGTPPRRATRLLRPGRGASPAPRSAGDRRTGGEARGPGWWGSAQSLVALAAALVVMSTLVGLGALGMLGNTGIADVQASDETQVAAESAPSVAERAAEAILAYDHRTIDADQDAAERFMTSSFAEEYASTFEKTVKPAARTYNAQVSADVQGSSVIRAEEDRVQVLLFVDQTTRSTAHARPQVALNRVEFDMVERDGEWLVDDISSY